MRVVLIAQIAPAVQGLSSLLRAHGHEPVALLMAREGVERYGGLESALSATPPDMDVVIAARRDRISPFLRVFKPDVVFCAGFPWKIPAEALAVPRLGVVNGHPSLLPAYKRPSPVSWAFPNGEDEIGFTFHYMDAELDTGNILAQTTVPLADRRGTGRDGVGGRRHARGHRRSLWTLHARCSVASRGRRGLCPFRDARRRGSQIASCALEVGSPPSVHSGGKRVLRV